MAPETPLSILNYLINTPISMPHSGHTKKTKPTLVAKKHIDSFKFGFRIKEANIMENDDPIPMKKKEKKLAKEWKSEIAKSD